jgi:predicted hotdog family 3-hydroxylacyl-ACP dehydratase
MCLLERLIAWDQQQIFASSQSHRNPLNPLCKNDKLSAIHALEYGMQAIAIHGSLLHPEAATTIRYLAALREVKLYVTRLDTIDTPLDIEAHCLLNQGDNSVYTLTISTLNKIIVTAQATIIKPQEDSL